MTIVKTLVVCKIQFPTIKYRDVRVVNRKYVRTYPRLIRTVNARYTELFYGLIQTSVLLLYHALQ